MADMELVIKIPEEVKNRLCFGVTYAGDIQTVCEALNNSTPYEIATEFADRCRECGKMRKGYWKYYQNDKGDWVNECSACGSDAGVGYQYPYCPYCGAKMVDPQESEE